MKKFKFKSLIALVLAVAMLFSLNVMFDGLADTTTGLNGASGKWSEFDHSVYDVETEGFDVWNYHFDWPSSGTVLVYTFAGNPSFTITTGFKGVTVPAGLIVDFYKYDNTADTYTLLGHFDTTDGNAYTISSSTTNVGGSSNSSSSSSSSSSGSSSSSSSSSSTKKWGTVKKTFVAGTPSESYTNSYTDVPSSLWCYDAILTLTDNGLLNGYGGGKFGPNDPLTRAQLAIILNRMYANAGYDIVTVYANNPKLWQNASVEGYKPYSDNATATRAWAAIWLAYNASNDVNRETGLTSYELSLIDEKGTSLLYTHHGTDSAGYCKHYYDPTWHKGFMFQETYDIWRASLSKNLTYRASIDEFPDADAIHAWIDENADAICPYMVIRGTHEYKVEMCEKYLLIAYNLGFFRGVDDQGTFDPYGSLTRGQLCQALYNTGLTYAGCLNYDEFDIGLN